MKCPTGFHTHQQDGAPTSSLWVETKPHPAGSAGRGQEPVAQTPVSSPGQREVLLTPVLRQRSPRAKDPRSRCILPSLLCPGASVYVSLYPARPQRASCRLLPRASLKPQGAPRAGEQGPKAELDGNQTCPAGAKECRGPRTRSSRGQGSSGAYQVPSQPNSLLP